MSRLIVCAGCKKRRPPVERDAIWCAECWAPIDAKLDAVARGELRSGETGADVFARIARNHDLEGVDERWRT